MIPKDCKRLAEVDFPIAEVSRHAAREKSIRHGHPSTLHLWWARRPLASSRAVLLALLWPDPCDPLCPTEFKAQARKLLPQVGGCNPGATDEDLRKALLRFIADFANWDNAAQRTYLEVSRALVKAAHGDEPPLVVDPFAGGGSIPLEALRVGCEAFASDLNPVACMILKVMLEDIPRQGPKLASELRRVGETIGRQAEQELVDLYPRDPDGARPAVYLWARTVRCEAPNCGAEYPVFRAPWLSKKGAPRARYFSEAADGPCVALVIQSNAIGGPVTFRIAHGHGSENAQPGFAQLFGTKARGNNANTVCPCCGAILSGNQKNPRTAIEMSAQRGGANVVFDETGNRIGGAWLFAVVTVQPGETGRRFRLADASDYAAIRRAQERMVAINRECESGAGDVVSPFPNEPINAVRPSPNSRGLSAVTRYGMRFFGDLFTARQQVALQTLARKIRELADDTDSSTRSALAMVLGRCADYGSSCVVWSQSGEFVAHTFGRQALSMVWDFAEAVPWTDSSGNLKGAIDWVARVIEAWPATPPGMVQAADAAEHPLPDQTAAVWFTDPPYYDAIPYADLSDFFFVWLKRAIPSLQGVTDSFDVSPSLTPKEKECVWNRAYNYEGRPKDQFFFETTINRCFSQGRRILKPDGVGCVVFAHQTTEGWEAFLGGLIAAGWTATASWPIATERASRLRARDNASLATSVHLVCRARATNATVGDWGSVLRELPNRVGDWMERLQSEGVRGADLVFACIGPALEIFSRYSKVETADGREVVLAEYLEKVWEVVGRSALAQVLGTAEAKARNGAAGAVEEDARLTALFLWTLQSTEGEGKSEKVKGKSEELEDEPEETDEEDEEGSVRGKAKGFTLVFDVVRRFAQPLGIELPKWEGRVIETKKGVVRLLPIAERAKQLFGEDGAQAVAARLEQEEAVGTHPIQVMLFPDMEAAPKVRGRGRGRGTLGGVEVSDESLAAAREATTLDRVHAAMLLQAGGRTNALRVLLKAEQERGPDFLRLANAFSALYPKGSEEKRLIDAMLLAMPR